MATTSNKLHDALKKLKIKKNIIDAILGIDQELFFESYFKDKFGGLEKIPIGFAQHSDDPITYAKMLQHLSVQKKWRVLEVGTGSGYSSAMLAGLVSEVVTVEYIEDLARMAKNRLLDEGIRNVRFFAGDATDMDGAFFGEEFDAVIILAACCTSPLALFSTLKPGGRAVFPMGPAHQQQIILYKNDNPGEIGISNFEFRDFCVFDSIRGRYGWIDKEKESSSVV